MKCALIDVGINQGVEQVLSKMGLRVDRRELIVSTVEQQQQQQKEQQQIELKVSDPVGNLVRICSYRPRDPALAATGSPTTTHHLSGEAGSQPAVGPDDFSILNNRHSHNSTNALDILHESPLFQLPPALRNLRRKIAIVTSGGDAPGMNSALRSIVRVALLQGSIPFAVMDGYKGKLYAGVVKKIIIDY
jgi:hypothetical protein